MKKLNVIYGCLVFVFLVSMCSCGARKVDKSHSKEENKTELTDNSTIEKKSETNVKTTTTVNVYDKNETVTEETVYEPSNNAKESFVIEKDGTKTVLNNAKKTVKKTTQKNNKQTHTDGNTITNVKDASKERKNTKQTNTYKKENSSKEVKKEQFNPFNLLWFIIPVGIIYGAYRIYKKLPLFPKF